MRSFELVVKPDVFVFFGCYPKIRTAEFSMTLGPMVAASSATMPLIEYGCVIFEASQSFKSLSQASVQGKGGLKGRISYLKVYQCIPYH